MVKATKSAAKKKTTTKGAARGRAPARATASAAGVKRPRSRSRSSDGFGTKAQLAANLNCDDLRAAFVAYQPTDAAWASKGDCEPKRKALITKASRDTLLAAYIEKTGAPAPPAAVPKAKRAAKAKTGAPAAAAAAAPKLKVHKGGLKGTGGLRKTRGCASLPAEDLCETNPSCLWDALAKARGEGGCRPKSQVKGAKLTPAEVLLHNALDDVKEKLKVHKRLYEVSALHDEKDASVQAVYVASALLEKNGTIRAVYLTSPYLNIDEEEGAHIVAFDGTEDELTALYAALGAKVFAVEITRKEIAEVEAELEKHKKQ